MKNTQSSTTNEISESIKSGNPSPILLWLIWLTWVPFFIPVIAGFIQSHPPMWRLTVSLIGVVLFFTLFLLSSWLDAHYLASTPRSTAPVPARAWIVIIALAILSVALILINGGNDWLGLFYYASGYTGGRLPVARIVPVVIVLVFLVIVTGLLTHTGLYGIGQATLFTAVIGVIIASVGRVVRTSQKLRMAREEIARLAVTAERLRIARDLHDLLGHNLSLITLKSELAGRLISAQPERAAQEIKDIEQVARTTLQEVREAVSSYRQSTVSGELEAARDILAAAGILYRFEGDKVAMPSAIERTFSWIIREGVTNVIKHSRAHECVIRLKQEKQAVSLEVVDDGLASPEGMSTIGNGLRGLEERVVALGGQFEAAPSVSGGFRLAVSVPLASGK